MRSAPPIVYIAVAVLLFLVLISIRRRREAIRHVIRRVLITEAAYFGVVFVLVKTQRTPLECVLGGVVAGLVVGQMLRGRSRHVPASVKRRVRAEFELRTGKKFNPRKHEYDHGVPFSRGGSHTTDNVRVVERAKNRSKGARSPWWDLLGR